MAGEKNFSRGVHGCYFTGGNGGSRAELRVDNEWSGVSGDEGVTGKTAGQAIGLFPPTIRLLLKPYSLWAQYFSVFSAASCSKPGC
jgi:hypothetical protein